MDKLKLYKSKIPVYNGTLSDAGAYYFTKPSPHYRVNTFNLEIPYKILSQDNKLDINNDLVIFKIS